MKRCSCLLLALLFLASCNNDNSSAQTTTSNNEQEKESTKEKEKEEEPKEEKEKPTDYCLNSKTLAKLQADGSYKYEPCEGLCTLATCKKSGEYSLPTSCNKGDAPYCLGDTIAVSCEVSLMDDEGKKVVPIITHCGDGRFCQNGLCLQRPNHQGCLANYCQDLHTLAICKNGTIKEEKCYENELCIADKCLEASGITTCKNKEDCPSNEVCHDNLCYPESNLNAKENASCDNQTFNEYCDGNIEVKCGYDNTVEYNDCAPYNGCAMLVQIAYPSEIIIRNAVCRGENEPLQQCSQAGLVSNNCLNMEDPEYPVLSLYYSLANLCEVATDGTMVVRKQRYETNCGIDKCNEETGLCFE